MKKNKSDKNESPITKVENYLEKAERLVDEHLISKEALDPEHERADWEDYLDIDPKLYRESLAYATRKILNEHAENKRGLPIEKEIKKLLMSTKKSPEKFLSELSREAETKNNEMSEDDNVKAIASSVMTLHERFLEVASLINPDAKKDAKNALRDAAENKPVKKAHKAEKSPKSDKTFEKAYASLQTAVQDVIDEHKDDDRRVIIAQPSIRNMILKQFKERTNDKVVKEWITNAESPITNNEQGTISNPINTLYEDLKDRLIANGKKIKQKSHIAQVLKAVSTMLQQQGNNINYSTNDALNWNFLVEDVNNVVSKKEVPDYNQFSQLNTVNRPGYEKETTTAAENLKANIGIEPNEIDNGFSEALTSLKAKIDGKDMTGALMRDAMLEQLKEYDDRYGYFVGNIIDHAESEIMKAKKETGEAETNGYSIENLFKDLTDQFITNEVEIIPKDRINEVFRAIVTVLQENQEATGFDVSDFLERRELELTEEELKQATEETAEADEEILSEVNEDKLPQGKDNSEKGKGELSNEKIIHELEEKRDALSNEIKAGVPNEEQKSAMNKALQKLRAKITNLEKNIPHEPLPAQKLTEGQKLYNSLEPGNVDQLLKSKEIKNTTTLHKAQEKIKQWVKKAKLRPRKSKIRVAHYTKARDEAEKNLNTIQEAKQIAKANKGLEGGGRFDSSSNVYVDHEIIIQKDDKKDLAKLIDKRDELDKALAYGEEFEPEGPRERNAHDTLRSLDKKIEGLQNKMNAEEKVVSGKETGFTKKEQSHWNCFNKHQARKEESPEERKSRLHFKRIGNKEGKLAKWAKNGNNNLSPKDQVKIKKQISDRENPPNIKKPNSNQ